MKSVQILIASFAFAGLLSPTLANDPAQFVDSSRCTDCHAEATRIWEATKHFASEDLKNNPRATEIANQLGMRPSAIKKPESRCATCHFTPAVQNGKVRIVAGVSCQSCHGPARDWIDIHQEFGGRGIKKANETETHRAQRHRAMSAAGMIYPADLYGFASNCVQCHLVTDAELINASDHPAGTNFDLISRSQGDILHSAPADAHKKNKLAVAGLTATVIQSYQALAEASPGSRFASVMTTKAQQATHHFIQLANSAEITALTEMAKLLNRVDITPGNGQLASIAEKLEPLAVRLAGVSGSVSQGTLANLSMSSAAARSNTQARVAPETKKPAPPVFLNPDAMTLQELLIKAVEFYRPVTPAYCKSSNPWRWGRTAIQAEELGSTTCFGLRVQKVASADLYLFAEHADGALTRLLPNDCSFFGIGQTQEASKADAFLPVNANGQPTVATLRFEPAAIYVVATTRSASDMMSDVSERISDVCQSGPGTALNFEAQLQTISSEANNEVQWRRLTD